MSHTPEQRLAFAKEAASSSPSTVAKRIGVDPSLVRQWLSRAGGRKAVLRDSLLIVAAPPLDQDPPTFVPIEVETKPEPFRLGGTALDRKLVAAEEENARLRKALRDAHRQALRDDEMREILRSVSDAPAKPPRWTAKPAKAGSGAAEVPVAPWADWHLGETVTLAETGGRNAYSVDVAEDRVRRLVDNTIDLVRNHGPAGVPGIVIPLMGDFVSGGLHPELQKTDEFEILPSILRCRDIMVAALTRIADEFGQVYCPAVCGNHGRLTHKPEFKRYVYKNADWLIYQLLIRHFEADPRVVVDVRPSNEILFSVFGLRVLAMHGDMMGVKGGDGIIGTLGPIARGEVKVRGHASEAYDILLIGHWHQELWLPRVIVSNTLKGYDEYARLSLRAPCTAPSQPLFFVHPERGLTSRWSVAVDEKPAVQVAPWVQVFQERAA